MEPTGAPTTRSTTAAVLIYLQAALVGLAGLVMAFLGAARRRRFSRRFLHGHGLHHPSLWGLVLLVAALALVAVGIGVLQRRGWAPVAAYVTEAVVGLGGLGGFHPVRSVLGLAVAVAVVILVATDALPTVPPPPPT